MGGCQPHSQTTMTDHWIVNKGKQVPIPKKAKTSPPPQPFSSSLDESENQVHPSPPRGAAPEWKLHLFIDYIWQSLTEA